MDAERGRTRQERHWARQELIRTWRVLIAAIATGIGVSIVVGTAIAEIARLIQP